ncbi:hypothetical protein HN011_001898 [Eciton burchellii]|nr:hypothetical protein HN011_001898 [Eciton burchellii]
MNRPDDVPKRLLHAVIVRETLKHQPRNDEMRLAIDSRSSAGKQSEREEQQRPSAEKADKADKDSPRNKFRDVTLDGPLMESAEREEEARLPACLPLSSAGRGIETAVLIEDRARDQSDATIAASVAATRRVEVSRAR